MGTSPINLKSGHFFIALSFVKENDHICKNRLTRRLEMTTGGDGGIRTHGPLLTTKRFRVVLVMTTSIHLHVFFIIIHEL